MRRRTRELSLFGMSSLDLFASALGAFILISIIIFPLIADASRPDSAEPVPILAEPPPPEPMVCPACPGLPAPPEPVVCPAVAAAPPPVPDVAPAAAPVETPPPPEPPACPVCPAAPDPVVCPVCPAAPAPAPCPAPAPTGGGYQLPHLDLVIAIDVTSSMAGQVAALKAEVGQLSTLLSRMAPSFAIGVVAFGDRRWERPVTKFALRKVSDPTIDRAAFRAFVHGLSVGMGLGDGSNTDPAEAFLLAMTEAARMPWRREAERKVIVLVTDYPAYPEEINRSVSTAAAIAQMPGHRVSTVYIRTQPVADARIEGFLQRVARAGRGQFVRDVGGSLTVNLLLSLL